MVEDTPVELLKEYLKERKEVGTKLIDVLTSSQKKKYEKMKGKPFDRSKLYQRRESKKRPDV